MGQIFSGSDDFPKIYVNFENPTPTENELNLYKEAQIIIDNTAGILKSISTYSGATELIRLSIANPTPSILEETWSKVTTLVKGFEEYYDCSQEISRIFPVLIKTLCDRINILEGVVKYPSLLKSTSSIIEFATRFDEHKRKNPTTQNDMSYYRRVTNSSSDNPKIPAIMPKEKANHIAKFLSKSTPMMDILICCIGNSFNACGSRPSSNTVANTISTIINLCKNMLEDKKLRSKIEKNDTVEFIVRTMAGSIILYDYIDFMGSGFYRNSSVDASECISVIKNEKNIDSSLILNIIRYNSKNFNDRSTPASIKNLFAN